MESEIVEEKWNGSERFTLGIFQLIVSLLLLSRGWLTWRWESPIAEVLKDENRGAWITYVVDLLGILLMVSALIPWFAGVRRSRWLCWFLIPATLVLVFDTIARWLSKDMQIAMLIEHSLQVVAPVALLIYLGGKSLRSPRRELIVRQILMIAAALTFVGHGLYAMGYYPVPRNFLTMTTGILPISEEASLVFLEIFGWLDFGVALLLIFPKTRFYGLGYMFCWGGVTALARIWAYCDKALPYYGLDPWLAETLVRTPHWAIPFWLLWLWWSQRRQARGEFLVQP